MEQSTITATSIAVESTCRHCGFNQVSTEKEIKFAYYAEKTSDGWFSEVDSAPLWGVYKENDKQNYKMNKSIPICLCKVCGKGTAISSKILIPDLVREAILSQPDSFIACCNDCHEYVSFDRGSNWAFCCFLYIPMTHDYIECSSGHRVLFTKSLLPPTVKNRLQN